MSGFILEYREIIFKGKEFLENGRKIRSGARNQRNLVGYNGYKDVPNKFFIHYFSARSAGLVTGMTRNVFTVI